MIGRSAGPFPGIVQKEFRENFKWAVLLMFLLSAFLISDLKHLATTDQQVIEIDLVSTFNTMALFTPLMGLLIGFAQAVRENRGDKWGFLTHRPVSRSTLFWGKAVGGILLYTAAAALPWIGALLWLSTSGHVPMPFDPRMALPGAADLLCGMVYYFAGLLTGMRDARWFATRALGIGIGIICSIGGQAAGRFEWAVAFIAAGIVINSVAAWGTFVGGGNYQTQPRITRVATGISIGTGLLLVCFLSFFIVGSLVFDGNGSSQPGRYTVDADGTIVHLLFEGNRIAAIEDLQGQPIEKYRNPEARDMYARGVAERSIEIRSLRPGIVPNSFRSTRNFFLALLPGFNDSPFDSVRWYYVMRENLIAAFDRRTAKLAGWLGPGGFSAGENPPEKRFTSSLLNSYATRQSLLAFDDSVYRLDLGHRRIEKIFTPSADERVLGAEAANAYGAFDYVADAGATFNGIVTAQRVIIQSTNGTVEMSVPFDSRAKDYDEVTIYRPVYAPDKPTFIWYSANRMDIPKPTPTLITKYDSGNAVVEQVEVPRAISSASMSWGAATIFLAIPVTVRAAIAKPWLGENGRLDLSEAMSPGQRMAFWFLSTLSSLASAAAIFARCRKFAFSSGRTSIWTALGFILGPFGFLLILALIEWPVREPCPACGRMRVVTQERCEHCSRPFTPPHHDGTEVFESI
jgi:hypothetical protein